MITQTKPGWRVPIETAYRRGYWHGTRDALKLLCSMSDEELANMRISGSERLTAWLLEIDQWRDNVDERGTMVAAPKPKEVSE